MKCQRLPVVAIAIVFLLFSGCVSTGGSVRGSSPATLCTPESCVEDESTAVETFGPVTLNGGLSTGNILAIAEWAEKLEEAMEAAIKKINEKIDAMVCGPSCNKEVDASMTLSVSLNPGGMNTNDPDCNKEFTTTMTASGGGFTCDLAALAAMNSVNSSVASAGDVCKKINPKCGAALISIEASDADEPFDMKTEESAIWCSMTISAKVRVRCGAGNTAISSPAAGGVLVAKMKCTKPNQCAGPITGVRSTSAATMTNYAVASGEVLEPSFNQMETTDVIEPGF